MSEVADNLAAVEERIAKATERSGRSREDVTLVPISKGQPIERIREGLRAGISLLGENRVQEARAKYEVIGEEVKWHLVGHLQRNKAKFAVRMFDLIHSLDSTRLADAINKQAKLVDRIQPVLLEVNLSGELSKFGTTREEVFELVEYAGGLSNVHVQGLMTIAPFVPEPDIWRQCFRSLRELAEEITKRGCDNVEMRHLSMGMSADYEVAIEEGATMVRIGSSIFGPRQCTIRKGEKP